MTATGRWSELGPEPAMVGALEAAGDRPPDDARQVPKKTWSARFADACAVALAEELRKQRVLAATTIFPRPDGTKTEFLTGTLGRSRGKRVDVSVSTLSSGLRLALSLKGGNFRNERGSYGHNLTGRLYELLDEVKAIHEYHPHAFLACVYFFPLGSTNDQARRSTFARAVEAIRACTGRTDPLAVGQFGRFDASFVALYVPTASEPPFRKGVCRLFDVTNPPPKHGRPVLSSTITVASFAKEMANVYRNGLRPQMDYDKPEAEQDAGAEPSESGS